MRLIIDRSLIGFNENVEIGRILIRQFFLQRDVAQRFEVNDGCRHDGAGEYGTDDDGRQQSPVRDRSFEHELDRASHLGI